jgi:hypothetical protein
MLTTQEFQEQIKIRNKLIDELQWALWIAENKNEVLSDD